MFNIHKESEKMLNFVQNVNLLKDLKRVFKRRYQKELIMNNQYKSIQTVKLQLTLFQLMTTNTKRRSF